MNVTPGRNLMLASTLLVSACAISPEPAGDQALAQLAALQDVQGCYQNLGQRMGEATQKRYLSRLIWPDSSLPAEQIEHIEVSVIDTTHLLVKAIAGKYIMQQQIFNEGQDFSFREGVLEIHNELFASTAQADNPLLGAGHRTIRLGLDLAGHGHMQETTRFAGTAFLIIPVAGKVIDSVRFERKGMSCMTDLQAH